jgi:acetoin utilization deacetylase AcuC-like enzyme
MKVVFDQLFYSVYTSDPASAGGRIEAVIASLPADCEFLIPDLATRGQLERAHTKDHINDVQNEGLYEIAALAAGGAVLSAYTGLTEPCFGLIRPPGHHASAETAWGFCYFNNMAVALLALKAEGLIETAFILDFDLHYGDGTVNILGDSNWVRICNPEKNNRSDYLDEVKTALYQKDADIIGISAGFDNHMDDWGGLLATEDYFNIGRMVNEAAVKYGGGCFAILEGGYNHKVLGQNVSALINGLSDEV